MMSYLRPDDIETVSHYIEFSETKQWWNGRHQINQTHARQNGTIIKQEPDQVAILIEQYTDVNNLTQLRWVTVPGSEEKINVSCVCFQSSVHHQDCFLY